MACQLYSAQPLPEPMMSMVNWTLGKLTSMTMILNTKLYIPEMHLKMLSANVGHFLQGSIDGLVQDCSNSIANALELLQSCTKPSQCDKVETAYAVNNLLACNSPTIMIAHPTLSSLQLQSTFSPNNMLG